MRVISITMTIILLLGLARAANGELFSTGSVKSSEEMADEERIRKLAAGEKIERPAYENVNFIGVALEEAHGQRRTEVAALPITDQIKRGLRSTLAYSAYSWVTRHSIAPDHNFNLDDHWDDLQQGIPSNYWKRFEGVRSMIEARELRRDILRGLQDQDVVAHSSAAGYAAYIFGKLVVDFVIIIMALLIYKRLRKLWIAPIKNELS